MTDYDLEQARLASEDARALRRLANKLDTLSDELKRNSQSGNKARSVFRALEIKEEVANALKRLVNYL